MRRLQDISHNFCWLALNLRIAVVKTTTDISRLRNIARDACLAGYQHAG